MFTKQVMGDRIARDFDHRRSGTFDSSIVASGHVATRSLGHPEFENLRPGQRRTIPLVAVFLDLTNFTGRTFWDHQDEVADLAHATLTGFIEIVSSFGGFPLGLRGDGLFAGFGVGDTEFSAAMSLSACAFALDTVETVVNPWLKQSGLASVQARAGLDYGPITFVRSGNSEHSEINPIGFAANFAAKCEKKANSWEIVVGQGLADILPDFAYFSHHEDSPQYYSRDNEKREYRFFKYRWRNTLHHLDEVAETLNNTPTSEIARI
ncbi:hypothetical protein GOEFS_017_00370 [Gordonia effusa NBRC 100432]|uniref:Guanylate cyclase domain-containing protein n=2 Tax=Gordonia effusa TaxID=263908 RepID=H0QVS0_9ACTN|nr:hypothetical protein GOEFS_017_00370 [Gordonia effusa NBRC 100432]